MLEHIVVLLDGSRLAESVLSHTRALAQVFESRVTLLHVLEPMESEQRGRLDPVKWHMRKMEAQSFLRNAYQACQAESFQTGTVLLEGNAASRIVEYIDETEPDLVMFSSHGRSGISPWNINSVAAKIVDRVTSSVMLVRAYDTPAKINQPVNYRRILVPVDNSKRAECVLPLASRLAAEQDAELWLALALAPLRIMHPHTLTPEEETALARLSEHNRAEAIRYLDQLAETMSPRPEVHILSGSSTAETLLDFSEENEIDLVIMAAHGYSGDSTHTYDSVVANFIRFGSSPLYIVQDLGADQIVPTRAEQYAMSKEAGRRTHRTTTDQSPAEWSVRQSTS